jgi:hypothetical protein
MGEMSNAFRNLEGNLKARDHLGDIDVDGSMISKWILNEDVDWILLAHNWPAAENIVMNGRIS